MKMQQGDLTTYIFFFLPVLKNFIFRNSGIFKSASRVFVFDYGGTLLHKEKFDIEVKKTMSAISGRRPTGRTSFT